MLGMPAGFCQTQAKSGRHRPNGAEPGSSLAKMGPKPIDYAPEFGTHSTNFDQFSLELAKFSPISMEFVWTEIGKQQPNSARDRANSTNICIIRQPRS